MSIWLTEKEFRQSGAEHVGVAINVAFFQEIKEEHVEFLELVRNHGKLIHESESPHIVLGWLLDVQEQLETYFSLEEYCGYFRNAAISNPRIDRQAEKLRSEHSSLFLEFAAVIETAEQVLYRENELTLGHVKEQFAEFAKHLEWHERRETELMMKLCNEDLGVGD